MLQAPPDHLAAQAIGIFPHRRPGRELMLVRAVSIDLLPDVLVVMNQPLIRHFFDTHGHCPPAIERTAGRSVPQPAGLIK